MKLQIKIATIIILLTTLVFTACGGDDNSDNTHAKTYVIGETGPSGTGIVFYITDGGLHGLEAAPVDQSVAGTVWITGGNTRTTLNGNTSTAIGSGLANCEYIIDQYAHESSAASICRAYHGGGKTDWFLPSKDELAQLYAQNVSAGIYSANAYWSSSEDTFESAWGQSFSSGNQGTKTKDKAYYVRAVRAF